MRKRTKKKIKKFFRFVIFLLLIFICLIIFVIKPGNPFGDIKIKDSDTFSKFETRRVTLLAMKEFLSYPAKLNKLTYDEKKTSHEREEWAKIYNTSEDKLMVFKIKYTTYKDTSKKDFEKNKTYDAIWVFQKDDNKWVFKTRKK